MELQAFTDPAAITAAYVRGQLRIEQAMISGSLPTPEQIAGYAECEKAHTDLAEREQKVHRQLQSIMQDAHRVPSDRRSVISVYQSWHRREYETPNGKVVPLAYEIQAGFDGDGRLVNEGGREALTVTPHVIHQPLYGLTGKETHFFTGTMSGLVLYGKDAVASSVEVGDCRVRCFDALESEVMEQVTYEARCEALRPWVTSFMSLKRPELTFKEGYTYFGLYYRSGGQQPAALRLFAPELEEASALEVLEQAFRPQNVTTIFDILDVNTEHLSEQITQHGAEEVFTWLMENLTPIRRHMDKVVSMAVVFSFAKAFEERLGREAAKVNEIEELAASLKKDTANINQCMPSEQKPAEE